MSGDLSHGPRLSEEEYERRVVGLYSQLPSEPTREHERRVRRRELELAIDQRLGRDFPRERREALWAIQEKVERNRGRRLFTYLLRRVFPNGVASGTHRLAGYLVDEYAKVLNQAELESFFGEEEARHPALPIDMDRLKE